jgi:hypothetical protein
VEEGWEVWEDEPEEGKEESGAQSPAWMIGVAFIHSFHGTSAAAPRDSTAECPICYEPLGSEPTATCTTSCRTVYHASCVAQQRTYGDTQCALCRAEWTDSAETGASTLTKAGQTYRHVAHLVSRKRKGSRA